MDTRRELVAQALEAAWQHVDDRSDVRTLARGFLVLLSDRMGVRETTTAEWRSALTQAVQQRNVTESKVDVLMRKLAAGTRAGLLGWTRYPVDSSNYELETSTATVQVSLDRLVVLNHRGVELLRRETPEVADLHALIGRMLDERAEKVIRAILADLEGHE